MAKLKKVP